MMNESTIPAPPIHIHAIQNIIYRSGKLPLGRNSANTTARTQAVARKRNPLNRYLISWLNRSTTSSPWSNGPSSAVWPVLSQLNRNETVSPEVVTRYFSSERNRLPRCRRIADGSPLSKGIAPEKIGQRTVSHRNVVNTLAHIDLGLMPPTKLSSLSFEAKLARAKEGDRVSMRTQDHIAHEGDLVAINGSMLQVKEEGKIGVQFWHISRVVRFTSNGEEWERWA